MLFSLEITVLVDWELHINIQLCALSVGSDVVDVHICVNVCVCE